MKRFILALAVVTLAVAPAFAQDNNLLIDDFEIAVSGGPDGTVDFGAGSGSSVEVTSASDIKQWNNMSIKVTYDAVPGGYMWIARGFGLDVKNTAWLVKNSDIKWQDYKAIAFYMYGSASKAQIAFDLKDSGGEIYRFITQDDFEGWKQIVCPFDGFMARSDWQPDSADKNDVMDFPIKSYQFEVLAPAKGTLYFDKVELIKK